MFEIEVDFLMPLNSSSPLIVALTITSIPFSKDAIMLQQSGGIDLLQIGTVADFILQKDVIECKLLENLYSSQRITI